MQDCAKQMTFDKNFSGGRFALPCEAASIRGRLKHSHLENRYLRQTQACLPAVLLEIDPQEGLAVHKVTRNMISRLLEALDEGFSALPLLDRLGPLVRLPERQKETLRDAIRNKYQEEFNPEGRRSALEEAANKFTTTLDSFLAANDPEHLKESDDEEYKGLMRATESLFHELESLPKGMFLWEWPEI